MYFGSKWGKWKISPDKRFVWKKYFVDERHITGVIVHIPTSTSVRNLVEHANAMFIFPLSRYQIRTYTIIGMKLFPILWSCERIALKKKAEPAVARSSRSKFVFPSVEWKWYLITSITVEMYDKLIANRVAFEMSNKREIKNRRLYVNSGSDVKIKRAEFPSHATDHAVGVE